jgi:hypothetical protein
MVVGLVVLMAALTYDESLARERRRERKRLSTRAQEFVSRRTGAQRLGVRLTTWTVATARAWWPRLQRGAGAASDKAVGEGKWVVALAREWWPYLRDYLRVVRYRWLTLESTTGQLLVAVVASLVLAYVIVAFG